MNFARLIEFVSIFQDDEARPYVGLYDADTIAGLIQADERHCLISFKDNKPAIKACGTYRHLSNRWLYVLEKNHKADFYNDEIIRPSMMIYHRPENIGADIAFFNEYQLVQFVKSLRPELFKTHAWLFEDFHPEILAFTHLPS